LDPETFACFENLTGQFFNQLNQELWSRVGVFPNPLGGILNPNLLEPYQVISVEASLVLLV